MRQKAFFAASKSGEVCLGLSERRDICTVTKIWFLELQRVVFPKADWADQMASRRLIIQSFVPATGACMFFSSEHLLASLTVRIQRTEAAAAADSGPLERVVRPFLRHVRRIRRTADL